MTTNTKCDRCGATIDTEAVAMGWPVAVTPDGGDPAEDVEYVCPDCYGDEAHCRQCGAVLPADDEGDLCDDCEAV